MKERENREFWIRETTVLLAMLSIDIFVFLCIFHYRVSSGAPESGPRLN